MKSRKVSVTWYRCLEYATCNTYGQAPPMFTCVRWGYVEEAPKESRCEHGRCEAIIGFWERVDKGRPIKARAVLRCCKCANED